MKTLNKHVFVWVFAFLLGPLGADRFARGQIFKGFLKLASSFFYIGIFWALLDWIIAIVKAYGSAFKVSDVIAFDNKGRYLSARYY